MSVSPFTTKDGRRYARFVLEDYNTSHEFTLSTRDYERMGMLVEQNNFLFIRGRVQPRPYREPEELEFRILSIQHLADVTESIDSIRIELDINEVSPTFTQMIIEKAENNKGKATLSFTIVDRSSNVKIKLSSKKYRVEPTTEFMEFLDNNGINYFLNI